MQRRKFKLEAARLAQDRIAGRRTSSIDGRAIGASNNWQPPRYQRLRNGLIDRGDRYAAISEGHPISAGWAGTFANKLENRRQALRASADRFVTRTPAAAVESSGN